jgi:hypothetical protein
MAVLYVSQPLWMVLSVGASVPYVRLKLRSLLTIGLRMVCHSIHLAFCEV